MELFCRFFNEIVVLIGILSLPFTRCKTCKSLEVEQRRDLCFAFNDTICSEKRAITTLRCCPGWTGHSCTDRLEACSFGVSICQERCHTSINGHVCSCNIGRYMNGNGKCEVCPPGRYGIYCGERCNCVQSRTRYCDPVNGACHCKPNSEGHDCGTPSYGLHQPNYCLYGDVCPIGAWCDATPHKAICICDAATYPGLNFKCTDCLTENVNGTCQGRCVCLPRNAVSCDSGWCTCLPGYEGAYCQFDVDECYRDTHICPENAVCVNTKGDYTCECEVGISMRFNGSCNDNCKCNSSNTESCDFRYDFRNGTCNCNLGWNGTFCSTDINECVEYPDICPENSICINEPGTFYCVCNLNTTEHSRCFQCLDEYLLDTCITTCKCLPKHIDSCNDSLKECSCLPGYGGPFCRHDIDECIEVPRTCPDSAICTNIVGSYSCTCPFGLNLTTDGSCQECLDEDLIEPCIGTCKCLPKHIDSCNDSLKECTCLPGYGGSFCRHDIDECTKVPNACPDKSICTNNFGSYSCTCPFGLISTTDGSCQECLDEDLIEPCIGTCKCLPKHIDSCNDSLNECTCLPGYGGSFCRHDIDECTELPTACQDKSICTNNFGSYSCTCLVGLILTTNGSCQALVNDIRVKYTTTDWKVYIFTISAAVISLGVIIIVSYLIWRKRRRTSLHYYVNYVNDENKTYDAFVSYTSSHDESFVLEQLFPKLETEWKLKLCVHFRDFRPGETIVDNILSAIENSKRTIMLITPKYVESEWCRMEYRKAQIEMMKHKHRIIPIILQDISRLKEIDKSLRFLLDSVTFIKWPEKGNKKQESAFWDQLKLSLPNLPTYKLVNV